MAITNNNNNPRGESKTLVTISGNLNGKIINNINNIKAPISTDFKDLNCSKSFIIIIYNIIYDFILHYFGRFQKIETMLNKLFHCIL
jgi:hypothetical protein